jgi:hypothetical protein
MGHFRNHDPMQSIVVYERTEAEMLAHTLLRTHP